MSTEAEGHRDSNLTPSRFLFECEDMNPGFGLPLDDSFSPYDATYKYLNPGTPRSDTNPAEIDLKTPSSAISMFSQTFLSTNQHSWSDMVFDEACMPMRQISPRLSVASSVSTNSSCSTFTPPPSSPTSDSNTDPFRSRMSSLRSDQFISHPEASLSHTHEYSALFDKLVPSKQSYHSELEISSLEYDSFNSGSLVPSETLRQHTTDMNRTHKIDSGASKNFDAQEDMDHDDQDMSDQHDSAMDVDSDESNDEAEDGETSSSKYHTGSRESSASSASDGVKSVPRTRTRAAARAASKPAKASSKAKKTSSFTKESDNSSTASRKTKSTAAAKKSSRESSTLSKSSRSQSRKHASPEEEEESSRTESPQAKRQKFLERNRMAASKCREKKRLQTLKTIADADSITARNQALHESLDELQEEVRTLKNQILCHRDCGCDVIQRFVQSSFGTSFLPTGAAATANHLQNQMQAQLQLQNQMQPCARSQAHPC